MRIAAALIAFIVLFFVAGAGIDDHRQARVGQNLFETISALTLIYCLLTGMWATSDCLSRERREGTLGLLFLTDLSGADVVLGKLTSSSMRMFYGLIAVFPILGVPLLLGGVTSGEYSRMCLVLAGGMFLSLSIGMFASSLCRSSEASMGTAFGLLFGLTVILPFFAHTVLGSPLLGSIASFISPIIGFTLSSDEAFSANSQMFWIWLVVNQLLCWSLLQFACRRSVASRLEKSGAPRPAQSEAQAAETRLRTLTDARQRRHLLDISPILWLVTRKRFRQKSIWLFVSLVMAVSAICLLIMGKDFFDPAMCLFLILGSHAVVKAWAASEAANLIVENRKNDTFELLASTRLTSADFFDGQLQAIRRQFRPPIVTLLALDCAIITGMFLAEYKSSGINYSAVRWLLMGSMAFLFVETETVARVSLWQGLTVSNPNKASGNAFFWVVILPCAFFLILVLVARSFANIPLKLAILGWWFLSMVVNRRFRERAEEGLDAPITHLETAAARNNG